MSSLLNVYHCLPSPLRNIAASLRGYYLDRTRYGSHIEKLVESAIERESWSCTRWDSWVAERLRPVLYFARNETAYYSRYWDSTGANWENLSSWPLLEKSQLRAAPDEFIVRSRNRSRMIEDNTSGSTGTPLRLWIDREAVREWYALFEARCRRWYGVCREDRWAILGGQQVVAPNRAKAPFWVWNAGMRQLYLSANHLARRFLPSYVAALRQYRVVHVLGYTSALVTLAHYLIETGDCAGDIRVVVTNAEPLLDFQREIITAAFKCPVRETYGMAEIVMGASECQAGRLHLWPESGIVEVLNGDNSVASNNNGDLICTGLLNSGMPLVRYRVGDRISMADRNTKCSCGRNLPVVRSIEGRCDDMLVTADGRYVGRLDHVFKGSLPVREAQIIQESLHRIRVRFVPAPGFHSEHELVIIKNLRDRLGHIEVTLEPVLEIPRSANGKFRMVVNQIPKSCLASQGPTDRCLTVSP